MIQRKNRYLIVECMNRTPALYVACISVALTGCMSPAFHAPPAVGRPPYWPERSHAFPEYHSLGENNLLAEIRNRDRLIEMLKANIQLLETEIQSLSDQVKKLEAQEP